MFQIKCFNNISDEGLKLLTSNYQVTDDLKAAEGVLVRSASLQDTDFPNTLHAIVRAGAGVNNIPVERCAEEGIVVFNTPGANANAVKELVIAGMLLASRDIVDGINWVASAKNEADIAKLTEKEKSRFAGCELINKKLGVIGLGAVGMKLANSAVELGMDVYGYDPFISVNQAWNLSRRVKHIEDLNALFKECDYITIHVPLLPDTKHIINKESIAMMKDGVVVLNFARDLLVEETAMAEALQAGKVRRYVTDFPTPGTAKMEHAIILPHLGASTLESEQNCAIMAVNQLMDFLENGNIKNSVNFPTCDMGLLQKPGRLTILHRNIPNMIGQLAQAIASENVNISDMVNKSKNAYAYTMFDLDSKVSDTTLEAIRQIPDVLKVRQIGR